MALLTRRQRRRTSSALTLSLALCAYPLAAAQETLENDVKAAFLFNFAKFVDWPPAAFRSPADPLRICVIADATFTRSVDRIIAGETVRGRALQRVTPLGAEVERCHLLYVAARAPEAQRVLSSLERLPVLTVGETPGFLADGGVISFVMVNDRVRFDVNLRAAERAGLTLSSKLLRVARHVEQGGP